ncbi:MAG: valine--tRNA ligase [Oscillospiraceae bacterium]|nr:valine--tRNA ligase [Oscillospiraceae bacterium]
MKELAKQYNPKEVESRIYSNWMGSGYFHAEPDPKKTPYTIVMPPPNITGQLHMGHALDMSLQDVIIRLKRMQGYSALWLPGTDHASIATEAKIVEAMREEGITKDDIGRDGFLERAWKWKEQYGGRIDEQLKYLGSSCDWERERFTMDEGCSKAVLEVFCKLYEKGLIYRGERIINWCPHCHTSISDAEVEFEEQDGFFWHLRYPFSDGSGYLELATTRPETLLGDTAVAVNPNDERYKDAVGKTVVLPIVGREIPVVADDYVEMDFGTGVVKITPAHDPNDYEVGLRHDLEIINVLNEDATVNENGGKYCGMDRYECRKQIVKDLEEGGFLVSVEPYKHNVGTCYRCGTTVEPRISKQWFVKMQPLAEPAIKAVEDGSVRFVPERFAKTYFNWMYNIKDWCISRQLWWGHRIPAYYCDDCGEVIVAKEQPECCPKCGGKVHQDEDTLDTWFSSALWPFSTLGWPEKTEELKYFYPTDTLVTGYDIIFFWVARMIFSGIEHMGEIPFKTVFIHGLVRDAQGRKMSKSLGNGIDPLDAIDEYGTDALRFMLASSVSPGNDMRYSDEKMIAARNFCNKMWNAGRFILMNDVDGVEPDTLPGELEIEDKWILTQLENVIQEVTANLEHFELGIAASKVYDFAWDVFCDWYVELAKLRLNSDDEKRKNSCKQVLVYTFTRILQMLHPFMPFITEAIYEALPTSSESIMISRWPEYDSSLCFAEDTERFSKIMDIIKAVRAIRAEKNVQPSKLLDISIETQETDVFEAGSEFIKRLAKASTVSVGTGFDIPDAVQAVTDSARALIPLSELVDREKELARLKKELKAVEKDMAGLEGRLSNPQFLSKAPENVVAGERDKLEKLTAKKANIIESIAKLG